MDDNATPADLIRLKQAVPFQSKLDPLNLHIQQGQHWIVTGERGAGKTLLAETLAGVRRLTGGTRSLPFLEKDATYEERRDALRLVTFMDESRLARNPTRVHYYQQRFNAFDASGHPTVRQYLEAGGYLPGESDDLLDLFGIRDLLDREKIKLSSGQTRKVLLARELLRTPRILVIDNPYAGLDAPSRQLLNDLLDRLVNHLHLTLVLCGHLGTAPSVITHRLHLNADGSSWTGHYGQRPPATAQQGGDDQALQDLRKLWAAQTRHPEASELIRFTDVSIRYGTQPVLDKLSWCVRPGDKWVVSGSNGSGKSTLLSLIYADHPLAYANDIYLFGQRRGAGTSIWEIKRQIGFTSPELHTYFRERITARQVLLTGFSDTFTLARSYTPQQKEMVDLLLAYFSLTDVREVVFTRLSTGTQRLLLFCRALVKAPPLLLLDEPFQGLDDTAISRGKTLLSTVLGPRDTVVFVTHFREEIPEGIDWQELNLDATSRNRRE